MGTAGKLSYTLIWDQALAVAEEDTNKLKTHTTGLRMHDGASRELEYFMRAMSTMVDRWRKTQTLLSQFFWLQGNKRIRKAFHSTRKDGIWGGRYMWCEEC